MWSWTSHLNSITSLNFNCNLLNEGIYLYLPQVTWDNVVAIVPGPYIQVLAHHIILCSWQPSIHLKYQILLNRELSKRIRSYENGLHYFPEGVPFPKGPTPFESYYHHPTRSGVELWSQTHDTSGWYKARSGSPVSKLLGVVLENRE